MSQKQAGQLGRIGWILRIFSRLIWVRATLFSIAAVVVALLAAFIGPYLPYDPGLTLASGSVDNILNILATSMLAVTTFSLSIMVAAYASATANVTPRSIKLLLSDSTAQNTLSTFVGSFLFSIVGIVGLIAGLYSSEGRILLFFATLAVLLIVVATLLRWIEHLSQFGRVGDTILRVETATRKPLESIACNPCFGAMPAITIPTGALPVKADNSGYVQHIDFAQLDEIACKEGTTVLVSVMPGTMVHPARTLLHVESFVDDDTHDCLRDCFSIGDEREFDHDPRFGMIVLSEIASRALSPAVNDPGTAIDVAGAGMRLLLAYAHARSQAADQPRYQHVYARDIAVEELMVSFFNPIARDGAAMVEVQQRLIAVLGALADNHPSLFADVARQQACSIVNRSKQAMASELDQARVADAARRLFDLN